MTVTLRLVLDQLIDVVDPDAAEAAREIAAALVATAPRGCAVGAIVPAGAESAAAEIAGLADVWRAPLARPALAASWQLGIAPGIGGGLIHAPGPLAPLVRHDRVNDNDQTVVTMWELCAWEIPGDLPRAAVASQRALLRRRRRRSHTRARSQARRDRAAAGGTCAGHPGCCATRVHRALGCGRPAP
jgi:hypothetical protein